MDEGKGNIYLRMGCGLKQLVERNGYGCTIVPGVLLPFRTFFDKADGFFVAFIAK